MRFHLNKIEHHPIRFAGLLLLLVVLLFLVSLSIGGSSLTLYQYLVPKLLDDPELVQMVFAEIRLPRALIATVAGASMGISGAVMQGLLRNPLASPGLVGSASGAALGSVFMLYFGFMAGSSYALPLGGITGALLAMFLVYLMAGRDAGILTLILAGVAINSIALALVSLILNLAPSPYAVHEVVLWMLGSVSNHSMEDFWLIVPGTLLGWALLLTTGRGLDALTLGEETAQTMGFDLFRLRWVVFIGVALAVGSTVSITGTIGFIGLVVPHLLRPLVGYRPSLLIPLSALGGAIMLLLADVALRLFPVGVEIKVGVLTSLVGAPFFLYLIIQTRKTDL